MGFAMSEKDDKTTGPILSLPKLRMSAGVSETEDISIIF